MSPVQPLTLVILIAQGYQNGTRQILKEHYLNYHFQKGKSNIVKGTRWPFFG